MSQTNQITARKTCGSILRTAIKIMAAPSINAGNTLVEWRKTHSPLFLAQRTVLFLKDVALFYGDFLYLDPDGKLIVCPSMSPENIPDQPDATPASLNPTMDIAVCRELLTSLITAPLTLGIETQSATRWQALLDKLPAYQINQDIALKEWLYHGLKDNYHHRHLSHLYGHFPGREITPSSSPELFAACNTAVEMRKVIGTKQQTSWSLAHIANLYARLHRGEKAIEWFDLIARSCLGINLFTYHNDWRGQGITIDDGMLPPGRIAVLPALPKRWSSGRISGLKAHGDITLSIAWTPAQATATLSSKSQQSVVVSFPPHLVIQGKNVVEILLKPGEDVSLAGMRR